MPEDTTQSAPSCNEKRSNIQYISVKVDDRGVITIISVDVPSGKFLFADVIEETERYVLMALWEEHRDLGLLPLLKTNPESARILQGTSYQDVASLIWQNFEMADTAVKLLDRRRICQCERYASKLYLIAEAASIITTKTVALIFLDRARKSGANAEGLDDWEQGGTVPSWLQFAINRTRLNILHWFATCPEVAEGLRADYWRALAAVAIKELEDQGIDPARIPRKEFKRVLGKHVFESDESSASFAASSLCARSLSARFLRPENIVEAALKEMKSVIRAERRLAQRAARKPLLLFEEKAILPFGDVEEYIRMNWQCAGASDEEILGDGSSDSHLGFSTGRIVELVGEAEQLWRSMYSFLRDAKTLSETEPLDATSFLTWVFQERRRRRRFLRARYGIDMARRRILRRAKKPHTAEETARRAMRYADVMAFDAAAEAAWFTIDWVKTEYMDAAEALSVEAMREVATRAIGAAAGVLEALPLFHLAILERTSQPAVREAETYLLSGIGAYIHRGFPRLRGLTRQQKLERLPSATLIATSERRRGEPLIRGYGSLRNRVARILEEYDSRTHRHRQVLDSAVIINQGVDEVSKVRGQSAAEKHVLSEEVRAKVAKEIACAHLSPQQRLIMELKILHEYSKSEIAKMLEMKEDQVNVQRARAFKKAPHLRRY